MKIFSELNIFTFDCENRLKYISNDFIYTVFPPHFLLGMDYEKKKKAGDSTRAKSNEKSSNH